MSAKWLQVSNKADSAEILIQGQIGKSCMDDSGMAEKEFTDALDAIPEGKRITIGINSEGGSVQDGLGIFNAIKRRGKDITARIDGYAVSIASVIPLAAARVIAPKSSIWMIHEPTMMAYGSSADMLNAAAMLEVHAETITDIYAQEIGITKDKARAMMKAETWFRGDEALAMGFADECTEEPVAMNCFSSESLKHFQHIPQNILQAVGNAGHTKDSEPPVTPPASISGDGTNASAEPPVNNKTKEQVMDENKTAATAAPIVIDFKAVVDGLNDIKQLLTPKEAPPGANPLKPVADGLNDIKQLLTPKEAPPGANPLKPVADVENLGNASDKLVKMVHKVEASDEDKVRIAMDRKRFMVAAWNDIRSSRLNAMKSNGRSQVENVNTIDAALTVDLLSTTVITNLQNKLAALKAFMIEIPTGPIPLTDYQLPNVTSGGAIQTNPTNWESGDSIVAKITVTPAEISKSWHVTNAELQSGTRMAWLTDINAAVLANGIMDAAMVPVTVAIFGAASFTGAAVNFTPTDLQGVWADIKDAPVKNLILDGAYMARLIPTNSLGFSLPNGTGAYGFDSITMNNRWLNTIIGFACAPQAMVGVAGLPIDPPNGGAFTSIGSSTVPGVNIPIQTSSWTVPSTRLQWMCYDLIFGVHEGDVTAGSVMTSS